MINSTLTGNTARGGDGGAGVVVAGGNCVDMEGNPGAVDQRGAPRSASGAGCSIGPFEEADEDLDGVVDAVDDCPDVANPDQDDVDGDTQGDVCDPCPTSALTDDADGDGIPDACDGDWDRRRRADGAAPVVQPRVAYCCTDTLHYIQSLFVAFATSPTMAPCHRAG